MEGRCQCFPGLMKKDKKQRYFLEKDEKQRYFLKNGGTLLEELVSSCKGKWRCNPIRTYSAKEIEEATDHFKSCIESGRCRTWYKGTLDDRPVLIKRNVRFKDQAYREIAVGSQMSSHKNVLKLLGCCLEFSHLALVYEYVEHGHLNSTGVITSTGLPLSWKMRLKVAKDIANAITYLHTSFDRPIVHRDIKPSNIFLDKDFNPKLCDFSFCVTIPEGETHVKEKFSRGTFRFVDPDYLQTSLISERTDVYSFGILLCVFLTGREAFDLHRPENKHPLLEYITELIGKERRMEVVDPKILEGHIGEEQQLQLEAFLELALKCTQRKPEDRPLMIDVAKEIVRIEKSVCCPSRLA